MSLLKSNLWNLSKPPGTVLSPWGGNKLVGVNGASIHRQDHTKSPLKSWTENLSALW